MAEHTKGKDDKRERGRESTRSDMGKQDIGSNQRASTNRGVADMDSNSSVSTSRKTSGSGIAPKKSVTGSDYDGQLSE